MSRMTIVSRAFVNLCQCGMVALVLCFGQDTISSQQANSQSVTPPLSDYSQLVAQKSPPVKKHKRRRSFGMPISTYWSPPVINDASVKQMTDGGFNLIWGKESDLNLAAKYKRRLMISNDLLRPEVLDNPVELAKLNAFIDRVKQHPALYFYFITDEPSAAAFPALGRLVSHLRARDPAHWAYINLLPTYATNAQLGTKGDATTAYREYLRQFVTVVKPDFLSYDHYHFAAHGDGGQYFLNLSLIRETAITHDLPFINIVQASKWSDEVRVPTSNEMRWLNYTSLAYGAQGLSYFVYYFKEAFEKFGVNGGQMVRADGSTTVQYTAAKVLNPQFVALAKELQPLNSLGVYHVGGNYEGSKALAKGAPFRLDLGDRSKSKNPMLLGYFGQSRTTHILVVNLDYKNQVKTKVLSSVRLEMFDPVRRVWRYNPTKVITLPPGGGMLVRQK
jgi:hypothetical protein